jgi:hypothetical protein
MVKMKYAVRQAVVLPTSIRSGEPFRVVFFPLESERSPVLVKDTIVPGIYN